MNTIATVIRHHCERHPDRPAIVATGREPLAWRDLLAYTDGVRAVLRGGGLDGDARIAVALPNGPEAALVIVAIACSAVGVPFDPKLTLAEVDFRLNMLRLSAVVVPHGAESVLRTAAERAGLVVIEAWNRSPGRLEADLIISRAAPAPSAGEPHTDSLAFILQTSGTTGQPKLIPYSHGNMLAATQRLQSWFNLSEDDRCLSAAPIYYGAGLKLTVFAALLSGGSTAFPRDGLRVDIEEWFGALQPTWFPAGPTLHRRMMEKVAQSGHAPHRLRFVLSGGAALPAAVHSGLEAALGVPVLEHYATSEVTVMSTNLMPPGPARSGTCGIPDPDLLIVVDDDGREVPRGQEGELWLRGPTIMPGYLNAPELNAGSFVGGWFRTGDFGRLDADGYLVIVGRKNEIINRGAEKISPAEIDAALMRHPEVVDAAAYGVPHPRLGEDVAADVILRSGSDATEVELRNFLRGYLALHKIPRRIKFVDHLPKGFTGKVQRRVLEETRGGLRRGA